MQEWQHHVPAAEDQAPGSVEGVDHRQCLAGPQSVRERQSDQQDNERAEEGRPRPPVARRSCCVAGSGRLGPQEQPAEDPTGQDHADLEDRCRGEEHGYRGGDGDGGARQVGSEGPAHQPDGLSDHGDSAEL